MESRFKLLSAVAVLLLILTTATIINVAVNFRTYGIEGAKDKAYMAANLIRDGLTSHMVNTVMDKRDYFLSQITSNQNIKEVWIVRSEKVVKQFGNGYPSEGARDELDDKVLKSGKSAQKVFDSVKSSTLRISIPYKAETTDPKINCLSCHDAQKGDVLGVVSMEFDITDVRFEGIITIAKILGTNILFLIIALFLVNKYVTPYMNLFATLQKGIKKAYIGDFTHRFNTNLKGAGGEVASQLNTLFDKIQVAFGDIKFNLATFRQNTPVPESDPLYEAKDIINELSDIYKFKKTIELDKSKDIIYSRIIHVLHTKYEISHFALYEINAKACKRELVYITQEESFCAGLADEDAKECRAYRTRNDVVSLEFANLCQACHASHDMEYMCIPYTINADYSIVVSISSKSKEFINNLKMKVNSIENYFEAAKPVIESKLLMSKLQDLSLRDGMTGLYNRRFLDNFIDKIASQAARKQDTYAVMMLDVDFFKMVNDTYGHDVGDKVIKAISTVLKENIRESDLAIRYGGEEFVVLLHNSSHEGSLKVANNIHQAFAALEFEVGESKPLKKTMSIGIAQFPTDGDTIWKSIKYADTALYEAKNTGRNKIVEFRPEMFESEEF